MFGTTQSTTGQREYRAHSSKNQQTRLKPFAPSFFFVQPLPCPADTEKGRLNANLRNPMSSHRKHRHSISPLTHHRIVANSLVHRFFVRSRCNVFPNKQNQSRRSGSTAAPPCRIDLSHAACNDIRAWAHGLGLDSPGLAFMVFCASPCSGYKRAATGIALISFPGSSSPG